MPFGGVSEGIGGCIYTECVAGEGITVDSRELLRHTCLTSGSVRVYIKYNLSLTAKAHMSFIFGGNPVVTGPQQAANPLRECRRKISR